MSKNIMAKGSKVKKSDLVSKVKEKVEGISALPVIDSDQKEDFDQSKKGKVPNAKEHILELDAFDFYQKYDASKNIYDPWLTLFERTLILGVRATQLENGAQALVNVPEGIENVLEIAELELSAGKLPLIICRENREYWRVADLADPRS
jgi:DNA-directed RNA polymerase subunit K/omega